MPETPDFDQIARTVLRAISDNIRGECPPLAFGPVRAALVNIWNARGAADIVQLEATFAEWKQPAMKTLDHALRSLDR